MTASRRGDGPVSVWAFGRRPATEAIRAGRAREVLVAARAAEVASLVEEAERAGAPVRRVPREELDALAGDVRHQGVAVRAPLPATLGERDLGERDWGEGALVVILDGIEDPQNVGAIARVAEAAGAEALVLRERRSAGVTAAAVRASAGALLHLPVAVVANLRRAIDRLRDAGFTAAGLDAGGTVVVGADPPPEGRVALVVGSEGAGLSRLVREGCDLLVAIPMHGHVESLNAATATAAALWGFLLAQGRARPPEGVSRAL